MFQMLDFHCKIDRKRSKTSKFSPAARQGVRKHENMSLLTRKSPQILDDFGQRRKPPLIVSQSELRGAFLAGIALILSYSRLFLLYSCCILVYSRIPFYSCLLFSLQSLLFFQSYLHRVMINYNLQGYQVSPKKIRAFGAILLPNFLKFSKSHRTKIPMKDEDLDH